MVEKDDFKQTSKVQIFEILRGAYGKTYQHRRDKLMQTE